MKSIKLDNLKNTPNCIVKLPDDKMMFVINLLKSLVHADNVEITFVTEREKFIQFQFVDQ